MKFKTGIKPLITLGLALAICLPAWSLFSAFTNAKAAGDWGFFGHRRINRMAVFTLPPEMIRFYKKHIEFVTEHAVDPDKRRYATKHEAVRHYIDIDHWGTFPFENVPRDWVDALASYVDVYVVTQAKDTLHVLGKDVCKKKDRILYLHNEELSKYAGQGAVFMPYGDFRNFFKQHVLPQYYEDKWELPPDKFSALLRECGVNIACKEVFAVDGFSEYGILPYNLIHTQNRLTDAFLNRDLDRILQLSADFGHYIGDAHVPLHTTINYNGQLTNQVGIHAFWESRLPELFADASYNFFVGKAAYISDPSAHYWDIVLTSHAYVDSLFAIEKRLSKTFPKDKQYCFEDRLDKTIRTQCKDYAEAFHEALKGQVEKRMCDAVLAIGSAWYTAWIDAGQPDLEVFEQVALSEKLRKELEEQEQFFKGGNQKGRTHE